RLVIDPNANYFWLSCTTATANQQAHPAVPAESRRLVRVHACLHRYATREPASICPFSAPTVGAGPPHLIASPATGGVLDGSSRPVWMSSNPAIPEIEIALDVHGQERIVIRPSLIFRQLDLLLGIGVGLALAYRLLHCGGKILQVSKLIARIVLGPGL